MIKVILVDDQVMVCKGLKMVLEASDTITVIGTAHNGAEALELLTTKQPDVVMMDLKMPIMNGIHATQQIKALYPDVPILILTTYDEDDWVVDAIRAGAAGYMLKDSSSEELIAAVQGVVAGRKPVDTAVAEKLFSYVRYGVPTKSHLAELLSAREKQVLSLLASGLSNGAIGERLHLAEGTIRNQVTTIFAKLEVNDRAQATALAWRYGLVKPEDA
ncbi:MAG: DNA-binding response regulator [Ardenticatenaceae bacterium]|nr:MAG: DNA-binding response regulator [Ardenticatenaceae bacterium]